MKTICIIKDERSFWEEIEGYLKDVNARVFSFDSPSLECLSERNQDLIIGNVRIYKKLISIPQNIPKIVITDETIPDDKSRDIYFIKWPISKDTFLEITSRLLSISLRRTFKTIISITSKVDNETCIGQSLDFSMSGMSFKSEKSFNVGDILKLGFFIPNFSERVSFDAEVMRSYFDPDDVSIHYGARFLNIDEKMKKVLEGFIKKIK